MLNRRGFLTGMTAFAGSYLLIGCGGGGGGGGSNAPSPGVAAGANPSSSATSALPSASASGAAASGSTSAGGSSGSSSSGGSSGASEPDNSGSDVADPGAGSSEPQGSQPPDQQSSPAPLSSQPIFYGINGHYDYPFTPAQTISILQGLNCTTYRLACTADPTSLNRVTQMASAFVGSGMTLFVCINSGLDDSNGMIFASESIAYAAGFANGQGVATALSPHGVTMYECGNELTRDPQIILQSSSAGNNASDFNNTNWPIMRGMMRGLMDGVKSVQPTAKCGINFCVADIGASNALWNGTQPDGSTGYTPLRWDITTWHNYRVNGDLFDIGTDGAGPRFDLPAYCKTAYGVPFMVTEWNANLEDSQPFRASYITQCLGEFYANRKADNIQSVMYYELDSGNTTWGVVFDDQSIIDPEYSALKNFAASNPDN
jgi:hypothetical protein